MHPPDLTNTKQLNIFHHNWQDLQFLESPSTVSGLLQSQNLEFAEVKIIQLTDLNSSKTRKFTEREIFMEKLQILTSFVW